MLKRVKLLAYVAAVFAGSLLAWGGCGWYGMGLSNIPRVVTAILNEEFFG